MNFYYSRAAAIIAFYDKKLKDLSVDSSKNKKKECMELFNNGIVNTTNALINDIKNKSFNYKDKNDYDDDAYDDYDEHDRDDSYDCENYFYYLQDIHLRCRDHILNIDYYCQLVVLPNISAKIDSLKSKYKDNPVEYIIMEYILSDLYTEYKNIITYEKYTNYKKREFLELLKDGITYYNRFNNVKILYNIINIILDKLFIKIFYNSKK